MLGISRKYINTKELKLILDKLPTKNVWYICTKCIKIS